MTKVGIDAVDPASVPADLTPDYVMGYVDGAWQSYSGMVAKFPNAIPVSITAIPGSAPSADAQMSDGEEGDYSPGQQANWALYRWAQGYTPVLYCSVSEWNIRQQAVIDIGLNPSFCDWMIAAYPGIGPMLYPGSPGHQWIDRGPYDEWVIQDGWVPARPHPVPTQELPDMSDLEYIRWCYYTFLGRDPDPGGFASWAKFLAAGGSRNDMMASFIDSGEGKAWLNAERKLRGLQPV